MGFLSRIVADARAHAPMVRATARDVDRTQAAAEGGEIVEAGPPLSPPSPSGVELAATLSATPPMAVAPRSATHSAPAHDDRNAAPDPAARAPGDRPGLPVVPSSSPASPAAARAAMTASGAPSTPQPLASRRAPVSAEPARSRIDEAAAHQVRAGVPDSRPAGAPEHTHARVDQRPAARATDDRGGPAREAPIAQIDTAAPPGGRTEPAAPQATRAAAPTPTPTLLEAIPPAEPQATPAARSDSLVPAPRVEISPSARATEPRRPERPSPMTEPVAARGVHIGRLEVIVVAPSQPPARPAQRGPADLASRRYLRNA
jgi:hypothetical protein